MRAHARTHTRTQAAQMVDEVTSAWSMISFRKCREAGLMLWGGLHTGAQALTSRGGGGTLRAGTQALAGSRAHQCAAHMGGLGPAQCGAPFPRPPSSGGALRPGLLALVTGATTAAVA